MEKWVSWVVLAGFWAYQPLGEISPYFSSADFDMLCGVAGKILLSCVARCANSPQQEFAK
jgi:hypothetical protein